MSVVSFEHLDIGYQHVPVIRDIHMAFERKEVICLLGANGCGKTTFLKTLLGLLAPLSGEIWIDQKPQRQWSRKQLAKFIGYVPQAHNTVFPFTAQEVVLMGRTAYLQWFATPGKNDIGIVQQCMETLGIEHLAKRNYMHLSGGEQQLVLIARALTQQPAMLVMDEPTASLDFGNQIRTLEHIDLLRGKGLSILMTTHQPEHAARIADRVVLFHQGTLLSCGLSRDVLAISNLAKIYGLSEETVKRNLRLAI